MKYAIVISVAKTKFRPIVFKEDLRKNMLEARIIGYDGIEFAVRESKDIKAGVKKFLDYLESLVIDILKAFPPGKLPPTSEVTQRSKEEIEVVLKGLLVKGGKSIYTIAWPPS